MYHTANSKKDLFLKVTNKPIPRSRKKTSRAVILDIEPSPIFLNTDTFLYALDITKTRKRRFLQIHIEDSASIYKYPRSWFFRAKQFNNFINNY